MKKMKNVNTGLSFLIIFIVVIATGYIVFAQTSGKGINIFSSVSKQYSSKHFNISIEVPRNYDVDEKFNTIKITNPQGEILLTKTSTNFSNLEKYLDNIIERNNPNFQDSKKTTINDIPVFSGKLDIKKMYIFYYQNTVYTLSTSVESLYDDLDQIAQSFRYTP